MGNARSNARRVDSHTAPVGHAPIFAPRFFALSTVLVLLLWNAPLLTGQSALRKHNSQSRSVRIRVVDAHDIRFVRLSTADGLSESVVNHVIQDDQGFVWFGTQNGLNRYDGYEFRVRKRGARNVPLSGTTITALFKDRAGHLWIGVDQSLNRLDPVTERLTEYHHDPRRTTTLGGIVHAITEDHDGQIWLATSNGLDKLNRETGHFTHYRHDENDPSSLNANAYRNDIQFVGVDASNTLWVETSAGINSFDPGTGKAVRFAHLLNRDEYHVQHVYQDRSGRLWIYSREGSGLGVIDPETHDFVRYRFDADETAERVTAVLEDRAGQLWLGTGGSGLLRLDLTTGTAFRYRTDPADPHSLSNNFVFCLFQDREGNIWAGTGGGGINRFRSVRSGFISYQKRAADTNSLHQNFTLSVFKDSQNVLWVGNDGVLNRIDAQGRFTFYRSRRGQPASISDGTVLSTIEDRAGTLWFATYRGGLNSYDRKTGKFTSYCHQRGNMNSPASDVVMRLVLDPGGSIWVATHHGLDRLDPESKRWEHFPELSHVLGSTHVTTLARDSRGILWLGTDDAGVVRFDPDTRRFQVYTDKHETGPTLSGNRVNALLAGAGRFLSIGTQSGLDILNIETQHIRRFSEQNGLPSNAVKGILEDRRGDLWVGTGSGLARISPVTGVIRKYYASDGLAGDEFNSWGTAFQDSRGEMFFPGVAGLTAFHPDSIRDNQYVPPVVLTDFRLFGTRVDVGGKSPLQRSISATDELTLSASQSVFSFDFSSLSYVDPERNAYRHKLDNLEREWNYAGSNRRSAAYTTLAPGRYVLRVQGSNNHGLWNENGLSLRIRILPPWWGTWWFRFLFAVASAILLWGAHQFRTRDLRSRERRLREVIETIPTAAWMARPDGSIEFVNGKWAEYAGLPAEDNARYDWHAVVHPEDVDRLMAEWCASLASGEPFEHDTRFRGVRDGEYRWFLVRAVPLRDNRGRIRKWYGITADIEDRKRARQLEGELAHMNRISALGELSSSIVHEVNQPLTGITSSGSACLRWLAADEPDLEEVRGGLRDIVRDGKRAGEIIARMRRLAKKAAPTQTSLDLNETVREVLALVADDLNRKNIALTTEFAEHLAPVLGDRVQLQQVVLNLVVNAIDAMSNTSTKQLVVATCNDEAGLARVVVQDTGTGLDPNAMEKIFEPFYSTKPGGMGMGLSISRSIVEHHGGKLWAAANHGKGTSIQFTIPQCSSAQVAVQPEC